MVKVQHYLWLSIATDLISAFLIYTTLSVDIFSCDSSVYSISTYSYSNTSCGKQARFPLNFPSCPSIDSSASTLQFISSLYKTFVFISIVFLLLSSVHYILILYIKTQSFYTLSFSHVLASLFYLLPSTTYLILVASLPVDQKSGFYLIGLTTIILIFRLIFYIYLKKLKNKGLESLQFNEIQSQRENFSQYSEKLEKKEEDKKTEDFRAMYNKVVLEKQNAEQVFNERVLAEKSKFVKTLNEKIKAVEKACEEKILRLQEEKKNAENSAYVKGIESVQGEVAAKLEEKFLLGVEKGKIQVKSENEENWKKTEDSLYSKAFQEAEKKFHARMLEIETTFENNMKEKEKILEAKDEKIVNLEKALAEAQGKLKNFENAGHEFKGLVEEKAKINKELGEKAAFILKLEEENKILASEHKKVQDKSREDLLHLEQLTKQLQSLQGKNINEEVLNEKNVKISELEKELGQKSNEIERITLELKIITETNLKASKDVAEQEIKLKQELEAVLAKEKIIKDLQMSLNKLEGENKAVTTKIEESTLLLHQAESKVKEYQEQLLNAPKKEEISKLLQEAELRTKENSDLSLTLASKSAEIQSLNNKLTDQSQHLEKLQKESEEKTGSISDLTQKLHDSASQSETHSALLKHSNETTEKLKESESKLQSLTEKAETLASTLSAQTSTITDLENKLKNSSESLLKSQEQIKQLEDQNKEGQDNLSKVLKDLNSLQVKLEQEETKQSELNKKLESIAKEKDELSSNLQDLVKEHMQLQTEQEKTEQIIEKHEKRIQELVQENKELAQNIQSLLLEKS